MLALLSEDICKGLTMIKGAQQLIDPCLCGFQMDALREALRWTLPIACEKYTQWQWLRTSIKSSEEKPHVQRWLYGRNCHCPRIWAKIYRPIMLLNAQLPPAFMVYAIKQAACIKNIAYHTASNMVLFKVWHCQASNSDMIETFGCLAIYHITSDLQELMKKDHWWLEFSNKLLGNHGSTLYNIFCILRKKVVHVPTAEFFPERFLDTKNR